MAFRWIVNAGLIAIPIGSTLGVLFGIDATRAANGQRPLFSGDGSSGSGGSSGGDSDSTGGGSGISTPKDNNVTTTQYCDISAGISPPAIGGLNYTLNPNQWGVHDGVSRMCLLVSTYDNETYPTNTTAPTWSSTWNYTQSTDVTNSVHAYPNIMVDDGLPIALKDLSALDLDVAWSYNVGNDANAASDEAPYDSASLNTNVAIDMFFDSDKNNATNSTNAKYEIMVWFAHFGNSAQTIGNNSGNGIGVINTHTINNTEFELYYGTNNKDQNVFTWVAKETTTNFTGDLTSLITTLTSNSSAGYPSETDYMGVFAFGSEAYYAESNVTFYVPKFSIDIRT